MPGKGFLKWWFLNKGFSSKLDKPAHLLSSGPPSLLLEELSPPAIDLCPIPARSNANGRHQERLCCAS
jgi:hypothetical protein